MLLHFNFGLRMLFKSLLIYALFAFGLKNISADTWFAIPVWAWVLITLFVAYLQDRIMIERKHTLLTLPSDSYDKVITWIESQAFKEFNQNKRLLNYLKPARAWHLRNDFIRIWKRPRYIEMKIDNKWVPDILALLETK